MQVGLSEYNINSLGITLTYVDASFRILFVAGLRSPFLFTVLLRFNPVERRCYTIPILSKLRL